jgi:hypothetical protein
MFKKPVIVAVAIYIKGIGCGGGLALRAFNSRLAVRGSKRRIYGGGCYSFLAMLPARHSAVETV